MSTTDRFSLYVRQWAWEACVQRIFSTALLGLVAISLAKLAKPGPASASPITQSGVTGCPTQSEILSYFHRNKPIDDPVNGALSLGEAEFYVAKYGRGGVFGAGRRCALARFHRNKPIDDPVNGAWSLAEAEFYVATYGADGAACTTWSKALARFHRAKPVNDPVNGAWSRAEAEFYVAKYSADGAVIVTAEDDAQAYLCQPETSLLRR